MKIALVDDDANFLAQAARLLDFVLEQRREQAEVTTFASVEGLQAVREAGEAFDMYLLDVVMPGMSGIELARLIRKAQPDAPIVFFTTSPEFALESYSVRAADYVVKPFAHDTFARALDEAFRRLAAVRPQVVVLKTPEGFVNLSLRDFTYAETSGHFIAVHTADGKSVSTRLSVQELWEKLGCDERFVRVGRQLLVNLAQTKNFSGGTLFLVGGAKLAVPRRSLPEVRDAFMRFY